MGRCIAGSGVKKGPAAGEGAPITPDEPDVLDGNVSAQNVFSLGRHLVRAQHYRDLRVSAFNERSRAVA